MNWKNAKDNLPEIGEEILISVGDAFYIAKYNPANRTFETWIKSSKRDFGVDDKIIIHWMQLTPPEK